jgi:tetratricopeptide (TPR) repeat protein
LQQAVELNPNGADGRLGLSGYYAAMGRMQESVQEVQRDRELDPLDLIVNTELCTMLRFARRFDEALAQGKANLDLDTSSPFPHRQLGLIYAAKGLDSQAAAAFIRSEELGGASHAMIAALQAGETLGYRGFGKLGSSFGGQALRPDRKTP